MPTRTITLTEDTTAEPAAGNRLILRTPGGCEAVRPPLGSVRLLRGQRMSTLSFGSPSGSSTLVLNGPEKTLVHLFDTLTGVTP